MKGRLNDELIAGRSPELAALAWTPSETELAEFRRSLSRESKGPLGTRITRALPIVFCVAVAIAGSTVVDSVLGASFESPLRSPTFKVPAPVEGASLAETEVDVAALSHALLSNDRTKIIQSRNELSGRLQRLSAADLRKVKQSAEAAFTSASQWLNRKSLGLSASGVQPVVSSTPAPIVPDTPTVHNTAAPVDAAVSSGVQTLAIAPPSGESDDSGESSASNASDNTGQDANRAGNSLGDDSHRSGNSGSAQSWNDDSSDDSPTASAHRTGGDSSKQDSN